MLRRHMADELILTGSPAAVQALLDRSGEANRRRALRVSHKGRGLEIGLVRAGAGASPELINRLIALSRSNQLKVSVEPNCTTGNPYGQELSPWDWEISPWDWEISPWDWEISPSSTPRVIPIGVTAAEGESLFRRQPALRQIGLMDVNGNRIPALEAHQGAGVVVGIFDAMPTGPVSKPWLTLHPAAEPLVCPVENLDRDLSDHGLMAASLIHAVAPAAEYHLYETCTKEGYGTLYPLVEALVAFMEMAAGRPAVINLSLGTMCANNLMTPALKAVLDKAMDLGMVVVAAAGNRGKASRKVSTVPGAQFPAAFDRVIGVSACNLSDQRGTYSQRGDIAAYGGEDLGALGPGDAEDIIGMGASTPVGQLTGYVAMDAGTSFSTPLVAGAVALVLGDRLARGVALSANTCTEVLETLSSAARRPATSGESLNCTGLGAGILYLPSLWA